ncbi:hypothetical protein scyTo_0011580 [Scyliorhinus torazame]|uniref:Uncharacterized protein n=1 Tax=Scyliorhinus torazame TaxID=75743 RepID=A0A401NQN6_SCYTO|nr:hypothetical protein [Scyliorhinus torazame]
MPSYSSLFHVKQLRQLREIILPDSSADEIKTVKSDFSPSSSGTRLSAASLTAPFSDVSGWRWRGFRLRSSCSFGTSSGL